MECSAYLEIAGYSGSQFFLGEKFFWDTEVGGEFSWIWWLLPSDQTRPLGV